MDFEENSLKLIIGIAAAITGWLLAQVTSLMKDWLRARKIKSMLLNELADIDVEVDRLLISLSRDLQIYGAKGIDNSVSTGVSNFVFSNYYKDALLYLNQHQRVSYQLIHLLVRNLNEGLDEIRDILTAVHKAHQRGELASSTVPWLEEWGDRVRAEYKNAASLRWHVLFHLDNAKLPDLSLMTQVHESYLKYLSEIDDKVDALIEEGRNIDLVEFEKIYHPGMFRMGQ
ncbi:hypothetical protein thsps21_11010 [Pseudomonas sp. No.21]|uniref:hypothetical protein n=1 Tax=Pseudomonas tohonis TaxID=2725477 RepID=UPI001F2D9055|nr:hypothetical protein [Pseudomonas tohonis]GJN50141.1 hypothetical protein TUM20249_61270 [Pseudomonas tohonis]